MEDRQLSLSEVAGLMGVSERTVRRWIKSGKLKAYKPGRDYRIMESDFRQFIEESEVAPKVQWPLPFEEVEQQRKYVYLPWVEFMDRYAKRWEEKVASGVVSGDDLKEARDTVRDFGPVLQRLKEEETRGLSQEQAMERWDDSNIPQAGLRLMDALLRASAEYERRLEGTKLAQLRRERERVEEELRRVAGQ